MQITGNPTKIAVDSLRMNQLMDFFDGRPLGVPSGLRVVLPKVANQIPQAMVRFDGQVGRRQVRIAAPERVALDE